MNSLHQNARYLRTHLTDAEKTLWLHLKSRQMLDCKFRRQAPVGPYIADFVCFSLRLLIEVDGGQHSEQAIRDRQRDDWFKNQGYTVLRFWNNEVLHQTESVLEMIYKTCQELRVQSPSPGPSHRGRGIRDVVA